MSELPDAVAERVAKIATGVVSDAAGAVVADIVRDTITQLFWQLFNAVLLGPVLIYIVFYYLPSVYIVPSLDPDPDFKRSFN